MRGRDACRWKPIRKHISGQGAEFVSIACRRAGVALAASYKSETSIAEPAIGLSQVFRDGSFRMGLSGMGLFGIMPAQYFR
jgi:hypothetical protein